MRTASNLTVSQYQLAALNRIAFLAATAADVCTLFQEAGTELMHAFSADGMGVLLLDPVTGERVVAHRRGLTPEGEALWAALPTRDTLTAQVVADGRARSWLREDFAPAAQAILAHTGYWAEAAVPLQIHARVLGCLNVTFRQPRRLDPAQLELLHAMASHFAAAVESQRLLARQRAVSAENAQLYEELRLASAELARNQTQLAQRGHLASLGEMTAVLAHELRNPLAILGNAHALLERRENAEPELRRQALRAMGQELKRMNQLVEELLHFGRPTAPSFEPLCLWALVEEVKEAVSAHLPPQVEVSVELHGEMPRISFDARLIRQALVNLALNGAQAMPAGGRLTLRLQETSRGAQLEVEDEGMGITPEVRARMFEPFFTTRATGTGLGLALVQHAVVQHQGHLEVHSAPGEGTTFRIELPRSPSAPAPSA
ncbi:GAF domain-containing protein [Aggregicoccus sp. 17bor-14]|uniref:ATP-binding protein n=1 Tax=Myxococcaceae TaxID=31 RepID=UPI00129C55E5|nr:MULTISPECIES: ATP-binding protein [Myxococcaceae]MBF5042465.1 GAF domain-containing protein [Simulacricoccus sp. 17bor-14]MRI88236.1 GAF domain-containing protein [Aggregicoccus sp. 17bor-14]